LFTLGLHPERTTLCLEPLKAVLAEAQSFTPPVWIARLDQITAWWRDRLGARVEIEYLDADRYRWKVTTRPETTVLARRVEVDAPTESWADQYRHVRAGAFTVHARTRPWIGLSPAASFRLKHFLRQQGYVVEVAPEPGCHTYYFDQSQFAPEDERWVLAQIEGTNQPLLRLGRWPNGCRSALSITGDIDALTLSDYVLRFLGR
jgi:hypothetical protein